MRARYLAIIAFWGACALPDDDLDRDGYTVLGGDCDDLDASVHPDQADILGDNIDQDCDGISAWMRSSGAEHICDLGNNGTVLCSGDDSMGQLEVPNEPEGFVAIAAGDFHTCGITTYGDVLCWGDNRAGQCDPPVPGPYRSIAADASYTVGVLEASGTAVCWGNCRARAPQN